MCKRISNGFDDGLVDLDFAALEVEVALFFEFTAEVPDDPGETIEHRPDCLHAGFHNGLLHVARHLVESRRDRLEMALVVAADGLQELVPAQYQLAGETRQRYQPHYQVIDREDQVQIYEELSTNAKGRFTTSFTHRACEVKDNRLLPIGWSREGPSDKIPRAYLLATYPGGCVPGSDSVPSGLVMNSGM